MTVRDLIETLTQYPEDDPVLVYEPGDRNEPYQAIRSIERNSDGDITVYRD